MTTILHHLIQSIRSAAIHNPEVQVVPACILWPDKNRQWQAVIPRLLFEIGSRRLESGRGPGLEIEKSHATRSLSAHEGAFKQFKDKN